MSVPPIHLIGVPMDCGKRRQGCLMGPDAYRTAGLQAALADLGHSVDDRGNVAPDPYSETPDAHLHARDETVAWTTALSRTAAKAAATGLPIFMGGDHALALGTVHGVAAHAASVDRALFVLWLDAHTDYHTPATTASGNLHGTPMGYATGRDGFDGFPAVVHPVPHDRIAMLGLRSVDAPERAAVQATDVTYIDMRHIDEHGIAKPLAAFLDRVQAADGMLHVSLDVDFLDPSIAPAVGTTVPGGATLREAHLVMEMICDSGRLTSLDLVELNPFLDERGRTAQVMVDLVASAFGRRVFDRPTRAY
ncbi:arginase [uncultured Tateyamaria sp.]|uniref:arginase n=1 Tax=Tateyamaria sp. 1078 TaxID=3417464 RepID=UPI002626AB43|nr:arginase [uncultured Tateyamaria sp.]